jgi:hypothetical protein
MAERILTLNRLRTSLGRHLLFFGSVLSLSGCVLPVPHYTANTLQAAGRVIDAESGRPVVNASVVLREHAKTRTATDFHGRFITTPDAAFQPVL